jgi:predicted RNA-binding Zn-ribbon protein involved in translation (DUF1610 family)
MTGGPFDEQSNPKLRAVLINMWASLKTTNRRAACPKCGAADLPVRMAAQRRKHYYYVAHCGTVSLIVVR